MSELTIANDTWVGTKVMAAALGIHPITLNRLKLRGYFVENRHWRPANPLAPKSHLRWHKQRTLVRMNAD
jgi:hypothetical protein